MPRDNKTPLIQRIALQARLTFRGLPAAPGGAPDLDPARLAQLVSLVTAVRAADLRLAPRKGKAGPGAAGQQGPPEPRSPPEPRGPPESPEPPVTYMHICETEVFSMGVFLVRSGASIPLHDHPGMNGMLKVLYGKVSVRCFDKLEDGLSPAPPPPPRFDPPLPAAQTASLWRATARSVTEFSESSGPCLLTPGRDNLHQIDAVDGPAAFLDILAPPYDPEDGRDCHYYRALRPAGEGPRGEGPGREVWLLEVPQPDDFSCGGEPYPGPPVSV